MQIFSRCFCLTSHSCGFLWSSTHKYSLIDENILEEQMNSWSVLNVKGRMEVKIISEFHIFYQKFPQRGRSLQRTLIMHRYPCWFKNWSLRSDACWGLWKVISDLSYLVSPCTNESLYGCEGTETPFPCELPFPALPWVSNPKVSFAWMSFLIILWPNETYRYPYASAIHMLKGSTQML